MADQVWGTGRRKTSVARVCLRPGGAGAFLVNGRPVEQYFSRSIHSAQARQPLQTVSADTAFDVVVNVQGGGNTGQAEAIRHGLARALVAYNPAFRPAVKAAGFLRRDPRMVERKKPGRPKARKRFQFSKR